MTYIVGQVSSGNVFLAEIRAKKYIYEPNS
jgi:hypothetical protein